MVYRLIIQLSILQVKDLGDARVMNEVDIFVGEFGCHLFFLIFLVPPKTDAAGLSTKVWHDHAMPCNFLGAVTKLNRWNKWRCARFHCAGESSCLACKSFVLGKNGQTVCVLDGI